MSNPQGGPDTVITKYIPIAIERGAIKCSRCEYFYLYRVGEHSEKFLVHGRQYCFLCKRDIDFEIAILHNNYPYSIYRSELWVERYVRHNAAVCCFYRNNNCICAGCTLTRCKRPQACHSGYVSMWIYLPNPSHRLCNSCKIRFETPPTVGCTCGSFNVHNHPNFCGCNLNVMNKISHNSVAIF